MKKPLSMNAYILGGGRSKRMNIDKALLKYNDKSFIDITIECCADLFARVFLVGREYKSPLLSGCFEDSIKGIGPIGGIFTALKRTDKEYNFFVGIDYPFIDRELILSLAHLFMTKTPVYDGCIPIAPDGMHPLLAFYRRSCIKAIEQCIEEHNYRIRCIASYSRILFISLLDELGEGKKDKIVRAFVNINSYEDYQSTTNKPEKDKKKL